MGGVLTAIKAAKDLPIPVDPRAAAVVVTIKACAYAIGGIMLIGWATNTKSETEFSAGRGGVKFKHKTDKR